MHDSEKPIKHESEKHSASSSRQSHVVAARAGSPWSDREHSEPHHGAHPASHSSHRPRSIRTTRAVIDVIEPDSPAEVALPVPGESPTTAVPAGNTFEGTSPPATSDDHFELDPTVRWTRSCAVLRPLTPTQLFLKFINSDAEREFHRFRLSIGRRMFASSASMMIIGIYYLAATIYRLAEDDASEYVKGLRFPTFLSIALVLILTALLRFWIGAFFPPSGKKKVVKEILSSIAWTLVLCIWNLLYALDTRDCQLRNGRYVTRQYYCDRGIRWPSAMFAFLLAKNVYRPQWLIVSVVISKLVRLTALFRSDERDLDFVFTIVLETLLDVALFILVVGRDRYDRAFFADILLATASRHETIAQRSDLSLLVSAAVPAGLLEGLRRRDAQRNNTQAPPSSARNSDGGAPSSTTATSSYNGSELDESRRLSEQLPLDKLRVRSRRAAVCVTSPVNLSQIATMQLMHDTVKALHSLTSTFDAAVKLFGLDEATTYGDSVITTAGLFRGTLHDICRYAVWQTHTKFSTKFPLHAAVGFGYVEGGLTGEYSLRYVLQGSAVTEAWSMLEKVPQGEAWMMKSHLEDLEKHWVDGDAFATIGLEDVNSDASILQLPTASDPRHGRLCVLTPTKPLIPSLQTSSDVSTVGRGTGSETPSAVEFGLLDFVENLVPPVTISGLFEDEAAEKEFDNFAAAEFVERAPAVFAFTSALWFSLLILAAAERVWDSGNSYATAASDNAIIFTFLALIVATNAAIALFVYARLQPGIVPPKSITDNSSFDGFNALDDALGPTMVMTGHGRVHELEDDDEELPPLSQKGGDKNTPLANVGLATPLRVAHIVLQLVASGALFFLQRSAITNSMPLFDAILLPLLGHCVLFHWRWLAGAGAGVLFVAGPTFALWCFHFGVYSSPITYFIMMALISLWMSYIGPQVARQSFALRQAAERGVATVKENEQLLRALLRGLVPEHVFDTAVRTLRHNFTAVDGSLAALLERPPGNFVWEPFSDAVVIEIRFMVAERHRGLLDRAAEITTLMENTGQDLLHLIQTLGDSFVMAGPFTHAKRSLMKACRRALKLFEVLATWAWQREEYFVASVAVEEAVGAMIGERALRYRVFGVAPLHASAIMDAALMSVAPAGFNLRGPRPSIAFVTQRFAQVTHISPLLPICFDSPTWQGDGDSPPNTFNVRDQLPDAAVTGSRRNSADGGAPPRSPKVHFVIPDEPVSDNEGEQEQALHSFSDINPLSTDGPDEPRTAPRSVPKPLPRLKATVRPPLRWRLTTIGLTRIIPLVYGHMPGSPTGMHEEPAPMLPGAAVAGAAGSLK
jgi:hypothetical protein